MLSVFECDWICLNLEKEMYATLLALFWCHQSLCCWNQNNFYVEIILAFLTCLEFLIVCVGYMKTIQDVLYEKQLFLYLLQWGMKWMMPSMHKSLCGGPDLKSDGWWNDTRVLIVNAVKETGRSYGFLL